MLSYLLASLVATLTSNLILIQRLVNQGPIDTTPSPALASPIPCLQNESLSNLEDLVSCFEFFSVSENFYDETSYNLAQPTSIELRDWLDTIDALLHVDENCTSIQLPASLRGVYTISPFVEQEPSVTSRKAFCILSESHYNSASGYYRKGWGLFVVPASKPSLDLHFSAPHPVYDAGSAQQAAALFKRTGAKSLLITGRMRTAFKTPSTCITPSPGNGPYWRTDPTHEMDDPFFHTTKTIHRSQNENGGCRPESCAFIQMHGKAASTCAEDAIFMSAGLGRSPTSLEWYETNMNAPINRLQPQLTRVFSGWNISLPSQSSCGLTATTNVVGRLLNGVPEKEICNKAAQASIASGQFIHLEQSQLSRRPRYYDTWTEAIVSAFVPA